MADDRRPRVIESIEDFGAHLEHWTLVAGARHRGKRGANWLSSQLWRLDRSEPGADLACSPAQVRTFTDGKALPSGEVLAAALRLLEVPEADRRTLLRAHGVLNGDLPGPAVEAWPEEAAPEAAAPEAVVPEAVDVRVPTKRDPARGAVPEPDDEPRTEPQRTVPQRFSAPVETATAESPLVPLSSPNPFPRGIPYAPGTAAAPAPPVRAPEREPEAARPPAPEPARTPSRRVTLLAAAALVAVAIVVAALILRPSTSDAPAAAPAPSGADSATPSAATELGAGGVTSASPSASPKATPTKDDESTKDDGPKEPPPHPGSYEAWASAQSGMCLNVAGASLDDGAAVVQYGKSWDTGCAGANEQWAWVGGYGPDGSMFKIVNRNSGKCVDVAGGSTDLAAGIVQATCADSGGSQVWARTAGGASNGWEYMSGVRNLKSGYCVDNHTEGDANGLQMWQANCGDFQAQGFRTPA